MTGSIRINWAAIRFLEREQSEPEKGQREALDWTALRSAGRRNRAASAREDEASGQMPLVFPEVRENRELVSATDRADRGAQILARLYHLAHRMADQIEHRLEGREHSTPALAERESTAQILYQLTRAATSLLTMERQAGVPGSASDEEDSLAPDQAWAEIQRRLARLAAERGAG